MPTQDRCRVLGSSCAALLLALSLPGQAAGVPELQKKLTYSNPAERLAAAEALAKLGPAAGAAVQALGGLLDDKVDEVRAAAAAALGGIGKRAVPVVERALDDRKKLIGALLAVGKLGPQAVPLLPTLMKAWRPDNSDISGRIRQAIKGIGAAAVPHLIVWLKDAATVTLACDCLRDIGKDATAAIPSLVELLDKKGRTGRSLAADALGAIGDARVVPTLVSHIEPALGRVDPLLDEIAAHAARALGTMGPAAAGGIDALIAMLDCKRADDDVMHLRQQAALAIDDMGVPSAEAIAAVRRFAATVEGDVRRLATEVVERLDLHAGSKPERIASGLSSRSSELRRLALDCVAAQAPAPQTHLPLVVALLVHETLPDNQLAAIAAVLAIGVGSDEIAKALAALAKSADERIATAASSARETLQAK